MPNPSPTTGPAGPGSGVLRLLRSGAVASTVLGLAAGAHVAAGGALPSAFGLTGIAVVLGALCLLLAGRRFSVPVLATLLGGGQLALHTVFGLCSGAVPEVSGVGHHEVGQHEQVVSVTTSQVLPVASSSLFMTLAHVAATVAALALLLHGESLVWRLWAWLRPLVRVLPDLVRFVVPRGSSPCTEVVPRPRSVVARRVRRRGPPRVPALATTF